MNSDNVKNYINYGYCPMRKKQCIGRLMSIWVVSLVISFLSKKPIPWITASTILNGVISLGAFLLPGNIEYTQNSKFFFDGITLTYLSLILNSAAYNAFTFEQNDNFFLRLGLICVLSLSILGLLLLSMRNINYDKYNNKNPPTNIKIGPVYGLAGILFARIVISSNDQDNLYIILGVLLLVLSVLVGIGTMNFYKLYLNVKKRSD